MNKEDKAYIEWVILIALFRATVQQMSMLIGRTKYEAKMIFNRWQKEGDRMVKLVEKHSDPKKLEAVTEIIENAVHEIRKANQV